MSVIIDQLTKDHKTMSKLLYLLDQEVDQFTSGKVLDYHLVQSILEFLTRTSQFKHHKAEDEIYKWVKVRSPEKASKIEDLPIEHKKLSFLADHLLEAVDNIEQDNEIPRMWFASVAQEYSTAHKNHLRMEEIALFPLARQALQREDWKNVSKHLADHHDPEFEQLEQDELDELKADILSWHHGHVT
ncbi:hemerythrin domain-containing protein [Sneathiella aquimaris]|uniref:hemerythrin domain-containing protein n=1 Tax=Sneathiella aquimaris TaxID=2599305 RepID=UPI00146B7806|nr:hemerythrin domain-containing protein [Sneathiella aquimaris]